MSFVFKSLNLSDISQTERTVYKNQTFMSDDSGITSVQYRSGSLENDSSVFPTVSGSYWNSLKSIFYLSSSNVNASESAQYFRRTLATVKPSNKQYINKFYSSGSIVSIPQRYFGERIKPNSFTLRDTSGAQEIIIQDDGNGNLYAPSASESQSAATSISSSDNYIGNIFYNSGIVTLTETASWSGSLNYTEVTTGSYTMSFKSTQTIYTQEYSVKVEPGEFNKSMNPTVRGFPTRSQYTLHTDTPYLADKFTGSNWTPYVTTIALFPKKSKVEKERLKYSVSNEPIILARLPRPVKLSSKVPITFKLKLDL